MDYSPTIEIYNEYNEAITFIRIEIEQNYFLFREIIEKTYANLTEDYLKAKKEFEQSIQKEKIENKLILIQHYSELLNEKAALIPQFIFKSLYLSIYGFYESILFNDYILKVLTSTKPANFNIDSFKLILESKNIIIDFSLFDIYRQIRNSFVHRNGHIRSNFNRESVNKFKSLELVDDKFIIQKVIFIKEFLIYINEFTENILIETERKCFQRTD